MMPKCANVIKNERSGNIFREKFHRIAREGFLQKFTRRCAVNRAYRFDEGARQECLCEFFDLRRLLLLMGDPLIFEGDD